MKILFWTDGFWPEIGGMETQGLRFVKALMAKGHQIQVITQKANSEALDEEIYEEIPIKRFDFLGMFEKRQLKLLSVIETFLNKILEEFKPDIVHLNSCLKPSAFTFSLLRNKFSMRVILTLHSPYYYQSQPSPLLAKLCGQVDHVCCVSQWVLSEVRKLAPLSQHKLQLIYNGLPPPLKTPAPLLFSPPTLLLLGRFTIEKGFDCALKAFALLKKEGSDAQLLMTGGGLEQPRLGHLTQELKIIDSVRFTGPLELNQISDLINQTTVVVVPSYFETFGLVALEAMQMSRPVIATRVGGLPEVVSSETGLLVPPRDPEALRQAIKQILNAPEQAAEMGRRGKERAKRFSLDENIRQYEDLYR